MAGKGALADRRIAPLALAAVAAFAVAVWIRARKLTEWPMWLDEAYSAYAADKGYAFIWQVLPTYETHPPFYSTLLAAWTGLAGKSLDGFRAMGVVAGLLLLPVLWAAGRELARLAGRPPLPVAAAAVALAALSPVFVHMSRLIRPYSLIMLVYGAGLWALLSLARHHRDTGTLARGPWLAYLGAQALLFWLHNLGALYVASLGLALIALIGPAALATRHLKPFLAGHAIVAIFALPALLILLDQAPTWEQTTWLVFAPAAIPARLPVIYGLPGLAGIAASFILLGFACRALWGTSRHVLYALLIAASAPLLFAFLISLAIAPVFLDRTLVGCAVPLILLLALGAPERPVSLAAGAAFLSFSLAHSLAAQRAGPEQDWYGAVRWLQQRMAPGDIVYAYPNEGALPLNYALRDLNIKARIREIPGAVPARDPQGFYVTGSRGVQRLRPRRIAEIASDPVSRTTGTIWLLRLGRETYDPGDEFLRALGRNRTIVASFYRDPIDIRGLKSAAPAAQQPEP